MAIGKRIAQLRRKHQLRQKDLAKNLGVAVSTVSNYEKDCHEPDIAGLCKLADLFGVSVDYILGRTEVELDVDIFQKKLFENITLADLLIITKQFNEEDWSYLMRAIHLLANQYENKVNPELLSPFILDLKKNKKKEKPVRQ
ncbi:MAG: helix-turn-helix transcriptional regulator [Lachnospiraceae bacterium]|nr:helix-turn-helix transcriptional regulator [Lachnospiraceae bacterium]